MTSKLPLDLSEQPTDSQPPSFLTCPALEIAQFECVPSWLAHSCLLPGGFLEMPAFLLYSVADTYLFFTLNLGLSALEGIYNKALPPCRDERDTGESRNLQTCRVKGCLSASKMLSEQNPNLRTKTRWQPGHHVFAVTSDWLCSPFKFLHFPFQVKGPKMCVFSHVDSLQPLWTIAGQAPMSLGFSQQVLEWVTISTSQESS